MRATLKWLHLWLGLVAGLAFALLGLTGSVLAWQPELLRARHPVLAEGAPVVVPAALVRVLEEEARAGEAGGFDLPRPGLPAYQVFLPGGARRYRASDDGRVLLTLAPGDDPVLWLRELHANALAGPVGHQAVGVTGAIALFLLASGLWLWWPRHGGVAASLRWHRGPPARRWVSWHRSLGTLTLPLLAVVTLTGVMLVWHAPSRSLLRAAFADARPEPAAPAQGAPAGRVPDAADWARTLAAAQAALPGASGGRLALPRAGDGLAALRVRAPGEWHPVGRSVLWLDPLDGAVAQVHDASAQEPGARWSERAYPLHAGLGLPLAWRIAVTLSGLLPAFLFGTGLAFWLARRRRRPAALA